MTDAERQKARRILIAAGHTPARAEWMADSAPTMRRVMAIAREDSQRDLSNAAPKPPSAAAIAIRHAHGRLREALGTEHEEARRADLVAAIASASAQERNQK